MPYRTRKSEDLRKGRDSSSGAWYFVTWCTAERRPLLTDDRTRAICRKALAELEISGAGLVLAATIMPDHMHLLLELGPKLSLSQVIGKTKAAISRAHDAIRWQENFFEHRLRATESAEDFAFYIFMNPCVAAICQLEQTWPDWISSDTVKWKFTERLCAGGLPQPVWVQTAERFGKTLSPGVE